ncbi:MAG: metallophosphoesterase [Flavobacteriaceae bacterium]|nr:metallophosphoesterase [Flavobacteriaceae bacterium]
MYKKIHISTIFLLLTLFSLTGCATYNLQYREKALLKEFPENRNIRHSFYLVGDAGNNTIGDTTIALKGFHHALRNAPAASTALFLGDNIYPKGLEPKNSPNRRFGEWQLQLQTGIAKDFAGTPIFIPGNHDWYSGLTALKRQEKYIEQELGKNSFLPENGCPLKKVEINEEVVLLIVDSQWYITKWNHHPTINDDCEIKTRDAFFEALASYLKKSRGKTTIIAIHNPMYSNGTHGDIYGVKQHMYPVPGLGTLASVLRKTSGVSHADLQNKRYLELRKRMITLAHENGKVIFVSGHDHNLQYLWEQNLPHIISGSGSKVSPTKNRGGGKFSFGAMGWARLDVFEDGGSIIRFYQGTDSKAVFQSEVYPANQKATEKTYPKAANTVVASVYSQAETTKGKVFTNLWGKRYRDQYSKAIAAQTVLLDTLYGGLVPIRKGGGNQTTSLRLRNPDGKEYSMRALRKNPTQYLQAVAFKDLYLKEDLDQTYAEELLLDGFTGSHPYAPFAVDDLAQALGIYHTNPKLFWVPKQKALGDFNLEFGDQLYMIEERAAGNWENLASFGNSTKIISTADMLEKLRSDEKYQVDTRAYLRARLFDMLIGDWDRHEDQWRWATFYENKKVVFRPIPRDRDQAFSIMDDGSLLGIGTALIPGIRMLRSYKEDLRKPRWFNVAAYPLDVALMSSLEHRIWEQEAAYIQHNLTDKVIEKAFLDFPKPVQDARMEEIKSKLRGRRSNLLKIANAYYKRVRRVAVITGTDKDDWFDIQRQKNGATKVTVYRIKKGKKAEIIHQSTYYISTTPEIWIYGLDDKDRFEVSGKGNKLIKLRIVGGQGKDNYRIMNGRKLIVYDYKSKKNRFETTMGRRKLIDNYDVNTYYHKKPKDHRNQIIPILGFNPDDGFKLGIKETLNLYGFERNPFTTQHKVNAAFYVATSGWEFNYTGTFAHIMRNWNLRADVLYTTPNYSINFFGWGNKTVNPRHNGDKTLDYNRMRISTFRLSPSMLWQGEYGGNFEFGLHFESIQVENTPNRFLADNIPELQFFTPREYAGAEATYLFRNVDNEAFPTLGMTAKLQSGYRTRINLRKSFGYFVPSLAFNYKLLTNGKLVLATKIKGHLTIGDDYEFYQAANIGGNDGLRSFRNQRFTGKHSFYHSSDLRLNFGRMKTGLLPLRLGVFGGFDYGRVWHPSETSNTWHQSYGGGMFVTLAEMVSTNFSLFTGEEGSRFALTFGFAF